MGQIVLYVATAEKLFWHLQIRPFVLPERWRSKHSRCYQSWWLPWRGWSDQQSSWYNTGSSWRRWCCQCCYKSQYPGCTPGPPPHTAWESSYSPSCRCLGVESRWRGSRRRFQCGSTFPAPKTEGLHEEEGEILVWTPDCINSQKNQD